jgi:hypothetical protein
MANKQFEGEELFRLRYEIDSLRGQLTACLSDCVDKLEVGTAALRRGRHEVMLERAEVVTEALASMLTMLERSTK